MIIFEEACFRNSSGSIKFWSRAERIPLRCLVSNDSGRTSIESQSLSFKPSAASLPGIHVDSLEVQTAGPRNSAVGADFTRHPS